ncbi:hypothetical protein [Streptomyces sp. NPDC049887]|uniref:hypothetical protein n=1 Tax=Streptomyces sp. NPDC049887 TaxID=3155654 RepID=UPI00343EFACD
MEGCRAPGPWTWCPDARGGRRVTRESHNDPPAPTTDHSPPARATDEKGSRKNLMKELQVNRTVRHDLLSFAAAGGVDLIVASELTHPSRGSVRCAAAHPVAQSLREAGWRVGVEPLAAGASGAEGRPGNDPLSVVSYVGADGTARGIGVGASAGNPEAARAASAAVAEWSRLLRTRRVVVAERRRCCAAVAPLPHMSEGQESGGGYLPMEMCAGGGPWCQEVLTGESLPMAEPGLTVDGKGGAYQGMCPSGTRACRDAAAFAKDGCRVLVIGSERRHLAVCGLLARLTRVGSAREAQCVDVSDADQAAYVLEPGVAVTDAAEIVKVLRKRFPELRGQHPSSWCYAETDSRLTLRSLTADCDLVLVVGELGAAETHRAAAAVTAEAEGVVKLVRDAADLRSRWLAEVSAIGVTGTRSAPAGAVSGVVHALSGLGPLSVLRRRVTTEHTTLDSWPDCAGGATCERGGSV